MAGYTVNVEDDGWIKLDGMRINQRQAIELAEDLAKAVEKSININQLTTPEYHTTAAIMRRFETPLGQAIFFLGKVY
jgi:hypothetical protein